MVQAELIPGRVVSFAADTPGAIERLREYLHSLDRRSPAPYGWADILRIRFVDDRDGELFSHPLTVLARGWGDCDDFDRVIRWWLASLGILNRSGYRWRPAPHSSHVWPIALIVGTWTDIDLSALRERQAKSQLGSERPSPTRFAATIAAATELPGERIADIIAGESSWKLRARTGSHYGPLQISADNLAYYNRVVGTHHSVEDLYDPAISMKVGSYIMTIQSRNLRDALALAGYTWGQDTIEDAKWFYWSWLTGTSKSRGLPKAVTLLAPFFGNRLDKSVAGDAARAWPVTSEQRIDLLSSILTPSRTIRPISRPFLARWVHAARANIKVGRWVGNTRKLAHVNKFVDVIPRRIPADWPIGPPVHRVIPGRGTSYMWLLLALIVISR